MTSPLPSRLKVRPIAICVCRDGGRVLLAEGRDSRRGQTFYRPPGGTIEFGERGEEAVRREFRQEIGADLIEVRAPGVLENIFTYEGRRGHKIALVYDGRLADTALYQKEAIIGEARLETAGRIRAGWTDPLPGGTAGVVGIKMGCPIRGSPCA